MSPLGSMKLIRRIGRDRLMKKSYVIRAMQVHNTTAAVPAAAAAAVPAAAAAVGDMAKCSGMIDYMNPSVAEAATCCV